MPQEHGAAAQRAVREGRAQTRWGELVALMRAQDGLPSADDYAWADTALGIAGGSRNRPTR
ncbi:MAG TPA: hypothetical protein VIM81_09760 [Gammaproteobacteria bacterium]